MNGLHGMAHITGGGIEGNLNRVIPEGLNALIDLSRVEVHPVFQMIRHVGNVDERDMLHTFNMGVGFILVVDPKTVETVQKHVISNKLNSYVIGEIIEGDKHVVFQNEVRWE